MAKVTKYNQSDRDYKALEKLPAPIRYTIYESIVGWSPTTALKYYRILMKKTGDEKYAIQAVIAWLRGADETEAKRSPIAGVSVLYNYQDHIVFSNVCKPY
jgi:hypothetical protein